jgi:hypothetical protein
MKPLLCAVIAVALAGTARADEPTTEQLVKDLLARFKETAELFDSVKDKVGAEKAKPKLEALSKQILEGMEALEKRPRPDVAGAFETQAGKFDPNSVNAAYDRMTDRVPAAADVFAEVPLVKKGGLTGEAQVNADTETIIKGAKTYYTQHLRWPAKLADMADLFEKGADAFKDPWGNEYKFEVAKDETGTEKPYAWSERKVGDKTKVIGTKPPEKKQ